MEILDLSHAIEERAYEGCKGLIDQVEQKQAYHKAASQLLLTTVLNHCPQDADPTAFSHLQLPQLEPLSSLKPHVARPPMDPRFV